MGMLLGQDVDLVKGLIVFGLRKVLTLMPGSPGAYGGCCGIDALLPAIYIDHVIGDQFVSSRLHASIHKINRELV